jgi:hypothetical protein
VLLAVPALRALHAQGGAVTIAAQPRIGALLVALGVAEDALAFDTLGLDALFVESRPAPDMRCARHLATAGRVVCWFGARDAGFVRRLRGLAPDAVVAPPATATGRVWEHLLHTVAGVGVALRPASAIDGAPAVREQPRADRAPVVVSSTLREQGRGALREAGWDGAAPVVVVHPGAGGLAKRWPVEGFAGVVADLDATIVVHQGPADAEAARALLGHLRRRALALVDPPLPALAGVLASAAAYLGNDSGISHLAAAVGAPSVVLYTEAALPWLPWSPTARCLTVTTTTLVPAERDAARAALAALP